MREISTRVLLIVAVLLTLGGGEASGGSFIVDEARGEPDVADEAGAVTLLVRSSLLAARQSLIAPPDGLTLRTAVDAVTSNKADAAILIDLAREGTGLRATVVLARDGEPRVARIRAGDGDLAVISQGVLDHLTSTLGLEAVKVREVSLGELRPIVAAIRLRKGDTAAAARSLALVDPLTLIKVPAAAESLRGFSATVADRPLAALSARALGDLAQLDAIATGTDQAAIAARAFAAIERGASPDEADGILRGGSGRDGGVAIARIKATAVRGDKRAIASRIQEGLASDQAPGVLAIASRMQLEPGVQRSVLAAAERSSATSPAVASRIGFASARAGVDRARALKLVVARDLDANEVAQLEKLIETATDATGLRLRAEIAMRRSDGSERAAITQLAQAAPNDARTQRYQGWQLMSDGRPTDAAAAFGKAGQKGERARALLLSNDLTGAQSAISGAPTSATELVIASRIALKDNRLDEAAKLLATAETLAPASPLVHTAILDLGRVRADPTGTETAKRILLEPTTATAVAVTTPDPIDPIDPITTTPKTVTPDKAKGSVAIDPTPLLDILEAFPALAQLDDRRLVIAELRVEPPWYAVREANPSLVRAALVKVLSAPPYNLRITEGDAIDELDLAALSQLTTNVPSALVYRVAADRSDVNVELTLFHRGQIDAANYGKTLSMPGVVSWDLQKFAFAGAGLFVFLLFGALWLTRAASTVTIEIERAPDIEDEVLCVAITRSPHRPQVPDAAKFAAATKKAGQITKARHATFVLDGSKFKIPGGIWYVHLYGTFSRGNELRRVPDTCTQKIEIVRGGTADVTFSLSSKLAEVTLTMESEPKRGVAVWPNNDTESKRYSDANGEVKVQLPMGTHILHIEVQGQRFERSVQIVSPKMQRIGFNVARERRLATGLAIEGANAPAPARPEPSLPEPSLSEPSLSEPSLPAISFATPSRRTPGPMPSVTAPGALATPVLATAHTVAGDYDRPLAIAFKAKPRPMTPIPGELLLGRYKIIGELGRGAMGLVHHAFDEKLERPVAIKEMAEDLHRNAEAMRLFTQEAKALAQLNHSNIVGMYDQVTEDDKVYMIMEFVDGQPLADILAARGKFAWRDAVALMDQVCAGLAYAHARKVIHRDIKPANIFVTKDRTAKLGDFGLARVMHRTKIQRTEVRGTPLYMAPEQIRGEDVDHRADLYAIGCMFYELVTGDPPFLEGDILYAQLHKPPPSARAQCPDLPAELDELIQSLMAKSSDDRPGSANEVRAALKAL